MMLLVISGILGGSAGGVAGIAQLVTEADRPFAEAIFDQVGCRKQTASLRFVLDARHCIAFNRSDLLHVEEALLHAFRFGKSGDGYPDKAHRDARFPELAKHAAQLGGEQQLIVGRPGKPVLNRPV